MHAEILVQIAVAILVAAVFAFIANRLRQPLILGYVAAGVLVGQTQGFGIVDTHAVEPISELGLILLLFMIGLEIDLKKLRHAGKAIAFAGIGQFAICVALGLAFFPLLGFGYANGSLAPIYLAVSAAISSTMIVVKLLYDKYEIDTTAGRITLGILVFQDIWAILFLALQPDLRNPAVAVLLLSLAKGVLVVALALAVSRYVLPVLFRQMAKMPELLVLSALAWCFAIVLLAASLGLSKEMGALIAGVALSTFPYNLDVTAKVVSLRDFFITLFFVTLGTKIVRPDAASLGLAAAGAAFLVLSRFLSITPILALAGKGARVSFVSALNLAQISEFSLVICTLGVRMGHIDESVLSIVVLILVVTSVTSTYGILHNHRVFLALEPLLARLGLREPMDRRSSTSVKAIRPIVFLGFARQASSLLEELIAADPSIADRIAVVDFNPEVKPGLEKRGIEIIYGDISHADTLSHAHVGEAEVVISTIPDSVLKGTSNVKLLRMVRAMAPEAQVVTTAETFAGARELYEEGAAYVLIPRLAGAHELVPVVQQAARGAGHPGAHEAQALAQRAEVLP